MLRKSWDTSNGLISYLFIVTLIILKLQGTSDFADSLDDMKPTSSYVFKIAGGDLVESATEIITTSSIIHANSIASYEATIQAAILNNFASRLNIINSIFKPIKIFCDNASVMFYSKLTRDPAAWNILR